MIGLQNIDIAIFKFVNTTLSSALLDAILPWMREPLFWAPLYVFILAFMIFNFKWKSYWWIISIILTVMTADIMSSTIIKKNVKRLRPCNTEIIEVIKRVPCGSGYSFTSSHATNHFAIAGFLIFTLGQHFRKLGVYLWSWASVISFSQIYVGVHYPFDILCGGILGTLIAFIYAYLYRKYYGDRLTFE